MTTRTTVNDKTDSQSLAGSVKPIRRTDFVEILPELDGGVFAQQVGVALSEVAQGVVMTGRKGTVSLTFSIKQIAESRSVQIDHAIAYKEPTPKGSRTEDRVTSTPMHVGANGRLTLFPESQPPLFGADRER